MKSDTDLRLRGESGGVPVVGTSRFLQRIRQKFGAADSLTSFRIAATVQPVAQTTAEDPEEYFLEGQRVVGRGFSIAAGGVGNFGQVGLVNPNDSGYVIVPLFAFVTEPALGMQIVLGRTSVILAALATDQLEVPIDTRWNDINATAPLGSTVGKVVSGATASALGQSFRFTSPTACTNKLLTTLFPGWGIVLQALTANVQFSGSAEWRERRFGKNEIDLTREP
jgi:hypothetical protein